MNINRYNYEAFFLLYVDNELSAPERRAVDVFVQENPDLKMELDLLLKTVLKADDIVLDKKSWLYMEAEPTPLQEDLLLYADDELTGVDKKLVEGLIQTDKAAQAEWKIIQQTKLKPDTTVGFEDKAFLYRREAGRVISIKWWKVAAAAVLLGFGIWLGVSVYNYSLKTNTGSGELAKEGNTNSKETNTTLPANNVTIIADKQNKANAENTATTTVLNDQPAKTADIKEAGQDNKKGINNNASSQNITVQNPERQDNNLPLTERNRAGKTALQNINSTNSNQNTVANVQLSNNDIGRVSGSNTNVVETNKNNANNTNKADQAILVVQVSNTETEDNSRYLNTDDKQKRTTLGGLIRKAKRVVERTTNINTGEGVKIAGFEIALK